MTTIKHSVEFTQESLNEWYDNARIDYGVKGHATVLEREDHVEIIYTEDGVTQNFTMGKQSIEDEAVEYLFNVWMEG